MLDCAHSLAVKLLKQVCHASRHTGFRLDTRRAHRVNKTLTSSDSKNKNCTCLQLSASAMVVRKVRVLSHCAWLCFMAALLIPTTVAANEDQWADTIARTAQSVVSLQLSQLRTFDGAEQGGSGGTGFIAVSYTHLTLPTKRIV